MNTACPDPSLTAWITVIGTAIAGKLFWEVVKYHWKQRKVGK
jgi:hypothetical protein